MGTLTKAVTVGGALTGVIAALIWRFEHLVTDTMVIWTAVFVALSLFCLLLSWAITQAYKVESWEPHQWQQAHIRREIRHAARLSAGTMQLTLNGVMLLLAWPDWPARIWAAVIILGLLWTVAICLWSPDLWRWTFRYLVPRINGAVRGPQPVPPADYVPGDDPQCPPEDMQ